MMFEFEELLNEATERSGGLSDFGPDDFRLPMQRLLTALEQEAELNEMGKFNQRERLLGLLVARLRTEEYIRRYPKYDKSNSVIIHGSCDRILDCNKYEDIVLRHNYPVKGLTPVTIAMLDKYRLPQEEHTWDFVIRSYRHYYLEGKWEFATWKTQPPEWWPKDHYDNMMAKKVEAFNQTYSAKLEEE